MITHDYRERDWGYDYIIVDVDGLEIDMMGFGVGIVAGDYIIMTITNKGDTRYQFTEVQYFSDPVDMWAAKAVFAPR